MALDFGALDSIVNEAVSLADLAEKFANAAGPLIAELPVVGPEEKVIVEAIDGVDKALHALQAALASL